MKRLALALAFAFVGVSASADDALRRELTPTGKLRVGIGVGLVGSAFWTTKDPATGEPRGVTVDLARALGKRLGVAVEFVEFANSGEVTNGALRGAWDVAFIPKDGERAKIVDFGPAYYQYQSTFLVPPGSAFTRAEDADRPGVRIVGVANTATARAAERWLKNTTIDGFRTMEEVVDLVRTGKADALALGRESLVMVAAQWPGSRVLDGYFLATDACVAVPKGKPAALAYVSEFIEAAKKDGTIRRALDDNGLKDGAVPR